MSSNLSTFTKRALFGLLALFFVGQVRADESARPVSPAAVMLARLCVNEATWSTSDCAVIAHIRVRSARSSGEDLVEHLTRLHGDGRLRDGVPDPRAALRSNRASEPREDDTRPWIGDLNPDLRRPEHWNESVLPWSTAAPRWATMLQISQGVIDGRVPDPCARNGFRPVKWGGPVVDMDRVRAHVEAGWVPALCGGTRNVYLQRPR